MCNYQLFMDQCCGFRFPVTSLSSEGNVKSGTVTKTGRQQTQTNYKIKVLNVST